MAIQDGLLPEQGPMEISIYMQVNGGQNVKILKGPSHEFEGELRAAIWGVAKGA